MKNIAIMTVFLVGLIGTTGASAQVGKSHLHVDMVSVVAGYAVFGSAKTLEELAGSKMVPAIYLATLGLGAAFANVFGAKLPSYLLFKAAADLCFDTITLATGNTTEHLPEVK